MKSGEDKKQDVLDCMQEAEENGKLKSPPRDFSTSYNRLSLQQNKLQTPTFISIILSRLII